MKQKLIKCCACGKEELRGVSAKYCTACSSRFKNISYVKDFQKQNVIIATPNRGTAETFANAMRQAKRCGLSYGKFMAALSAGPDVLARLTADNAYKVFRWEASEKRHDDFSKESPLVYYTEDDSGRTFESRVFIRWYRGRSIKATAQELDCSEKRVANCLHALGCQANNGKRPAGLWELVETETGLRVRPKEVYNGL